MCLLCIESFDECVANTTCLTFEAGALLPNGDKTFDMNVLEIWGCGGDDTVGQGMWCIRRCIYSEVSRKCCK